MKKFILIASVLVASIGVSAQKTAQHTGVTVITAAKTSAVGDTLQLSNIATTDTVRMLYTHSPAGSGYTSGTNVYNDKGFAERYSFSGSDSSIKVIGVLAQFGGTVNTSSAKTVTLKIWGQGSQTSLVAPRTYYQGFPDKVIDSIIVPVTQLGIGPVVDTLKQFMFAMPTGYLAGHIFAGYTIDYNFASLSGDTIALAASTDGNRTNPMYTLKYVTNTAGDTTGVDTFLNVQNATLWSDGQWKDNYTQNDSLYNNLAIFPIVVIGAPTETKWVKNNNLALFGAYPNPAATVTNIKLSLTATANVSISIVDVAGHTAFTAHFGDLGPGQHVLPVDVRPLPAGTYLYVVRTSMGDGIAGKMEVGE